MTHPLRRIAFGEIVYGGGCPDDYEVNMHKCVAACCTEVHWGISKQCLKCKSQHCP